ncbi:MAG: queuosine precursor transporter [Patescibacteria group bacterium]
MNNEWLFIIMSLVSLAFVLIAFRMGKSWLIGLVAANVILANIFVVKGMYLFGMAATGGNVVYASIFLATDLLAEHYGKKEARQAVLIGFFVALFFLITSQFIIRFTPADWDIAQGAFETIFTLTPRIVIGSLVAYLISQNIDISIFHRIKEKTRGRWLWLRNNGSTFVSQGIDSVIFTMIAFWGVYPDLWQLVLFTWIIKIIVAALDTPFIYLSGHFRPKELLSSAYERKGRT